MKSRSMQKARALEPERYAVYCADDHIEVSFWDLEQMKVRAVPTSVSSKAAAAP